MADIITALLRSLASLKHGKLWLYMAMPVLLSFFLLLFLVFFALNHIIATLTEQPPLLWISAWGALQLAHLLAVLGGWMAILSAAYVVTIVLSALLVLPLLLNHLATYEYADLAHLGKDSFIAASRNSLTAAVLFVLGWLVTLPLWLIPGVALLLPFFWVAWLNRRTFAYDALSLHASPAEWQFLQQQKSGGLLLLGLIMALLAHVPLLGLFIPGFTALAYVHYCLESLRRLRGDAILTVPQS